MIFDFLIDSLKFNLGESITLDTAAVSHFILSSSNLNARLAISGIGCATLLMEGLIKSIYALSSKQMREMSSGTVKPDSRMALIDPSIIVLLRANIASGLSGPDKRYFVSMYPQRWENSFPTTFTNSPNSLADIASI